MFSVCHVAPKILLGTKRKPSATIISDHAFIMMIYDYWWCHYHHNYRLWINFSLLTSELFSTETFPLWEELLADNGCKEQTCENEPIFEVLEQYSLTIFINSVYSSDGLDQKGMKLHCAKYFKEYIEWIVSVQNTIVTGS